MEQEQFHLLSKAILRKSQKNKKYATGVSCEFISLNNGFGVKSYYDKGNRDEAWVNQQLCAKHGLAPEVGIKFDLDSSDDYHFCYITEEVKTIVPFTGECSWSNKNWVNNFYKFKNSEEYTDFLSMRNDTLNKMEEIGLYITDNHFGNFGMKNGKMVCIDFC